MIDSPAIGSGNVADLSGRDARTASVLKHRFEGLGIGEGRAERLQLLLKLFDAIV